MRSDRTFWAGLVVVAGLVAGGALLYDAAAVRAGGTARAWRSETADELARRHLDDPVVLIAAGAALLLGGWLLLLALTPGQRRWLPLGRPGAVIDRAGVSALVARWAERIDGVDSAKVRTGRGWTVVRIDGDAEPASVERELRAELARVPLAGAHRLDVRTGRRRR
ncbi:DUF6286 domain-containing protein [Kitasatospora sp. NPDC096147]|uniref:DUF6286 domain-containing protein n=1 Tax=Kitasatospora sp. NPDC096147 TaxID=3364093 RepID=UPI0038152829